MKRPNISQLQSINKLRNTQMLLIKVLLSAQYITLSLPLTFSKKKFFVNTELFNGAL